MKEPATIQILTNSRMRAFRNCERKHHYLYNLGLRPVRESEALRFGSLIHRTLELWWKGEDWRPALALAADPFERVKCEVLMEGYHARWHEEQRKFEVIAVEYEFEAPLLNPETMAASRTWRLAGKMDAMVRRGDRIAVVEHKSCTDRIEDDADSYWSLLSMDHQISAYVVGAESAGFQVADTLYDVIRKPLQRPGLATPLENRKFTKANVLYASQRATDETPEEFGERLRGEVLTNLPSYFQRRWIPRLDEQLRDFAFDAWQTGRGIRDAQLAGRSPRNPQSCNLFGRCAFWDVCVNGLDPLNSPDFKLLDDVHPELNHQAG